MKRRKRKFLRDSKSKESLSLKKSPQKRNQNYVNKKNFVLSAMTELNLPTNWFTSAE